MLTKTKIKNPVTVLVSKQVKYAIKNPVWILHDLKNPGSAKHQLLTDTCRNYKDYKFVNSAGVETTMSDEVGDYREAELSGTDRENKLKDIKKAFQKGINSSQVICEDDVMNMLLLNCNQDGYNSVSPYGSAIMAIGVEALAMANAYGIVNMPPISGTGELQVGMKISIGKNGVVHVKSWCEKNTSYNVAGGGVMELRRLGVSEFDVQYKKGGTPPWNVEIMNGVFTGNVSLQTQGVNDVMRKKLDVSIGQKISEELVAQKLAGDRILDEATIARNKWLKSYNVGTSLPEIKINIDARDVGAIDESTHSKKQDADPKAKEKTRKSEDIENMLIAANALLEIFEGTIENMKPKGEEKDLQAALNFIEVVRDKLVSGIEILKGSQDATCYIALLQEFIRLKTGIVELKVKYNILTRQDAERDVHRMQEESKSSKYELVQNIKGDKGREELMDKQVSGLKRNVDELKKDIENLKVDARGNKKNTEI